MSMNKSESKYYNTACLMDEALLALLENKDFDYITVKEICKKAGVNRSTFYLHYETINDLLNESLSYIFSKFTEKYKGNTLNAEKIKKASLDELILITPEYIRPYLEFLKENKRVFMLAVKRPDFFEVNKYFDSIYDRIFSQILERFNVEERERKYILSFYNSGMHSVIVQWIKSGCADDIEYISHLLIKYTIPNESGAKK